MSARRLVSESREKMLTMMSHADKESFDKAWNLSNDLLNAIEAIKLEGEG